MDKPKTKSLLLEDLRAFGRDAREKWKEIVGGGFVFLLIGAAANVGLDIPKSVSAIAIFCLAVLWACFLSYRSQRRKTEQANQELNELKQRFKPRLVINCAPDIPNCKRNNRWGDGRMKEWHLFLVQSGDCSVEDVRATLERIERGGEVVWDGHPHQLPFSPCGSSDSLSKTIRPESREYVSVVVIDLDWTGEDEIDRISIGAPIGWPHLPPLKELFKEFGLYTFTVWSPARTYYPKG